jgi:hypothetical protein
MYFLPNIVGTVAAIARAIWGMSGAWLRKKDTARVEVELPGLKIKAANPKDLAKALIALSKYDRLIFDVHHEVAVTAPKMPAARNGQPPFFTPYFPAMECFHFLQLAPRRRNGNGHINTHRCLREHRKDVLQFGNAYQFCRPQRLGRCHLFQ